MNSNAASPALHCLRGEEQRRCCSISNTPWVCSGPPHLLGPWGRPVGRGEWPPRTTTFRPATTRAVFTPIAARVASVAIVAGLDRPAVPAYADINAHDREWQLLWGRRLPKAPKIVDRKLD